MIARIREYLFGSIFRRGASLLTFLTLGSYILGLVRDMLFARALGASRLLDIYNAAFIVPDLLLNIFVAGALTAAFVPVFVHLYSSGEKEEAKRVASTILTAAPATIMILSIPIFFFMPMLSQWIAPGFSDADRSLLVTMSRLLLLSPIIFAASNTLGNLLISHERFLGYGISPILYNLGIIAGIPLMSVFGPMGIVVGTLIGALLHLSVRIFAAVKNGVYPRIGFDLKNKNVRQIFKLMIPRMAGQPIEQIIFSIFANMASLLAVGSIAMLSFARNFHSVPVSIFGIAFATAVFASLSRKAAAKDAEGFRFHFRETAQALAVTTIGSALFFIFFGKFVIGIFLGGGKFDAAAIQQTGTLLSIFALSIPAESFNHLLVRSFYALKDTWTPILVSIPGLVLIVVTAKFLIPMLSLNALPLSYSIAVNLQALMLYGLLQRKLRTL